MNTRPRRRRYSVVPAAAAAAAQTYTQKVLGIATANLIGYWPLNETSGTTADNAEGTAARDGAYTGVALNDSTFSNGDPVGLWDGTNDYCNIYTASFSGAFNVSEGAIALWAKVSAAGVWTDATTRYCVRVAVNNSNQVFISRTTTNDQLMLRYSAGGTSETVTTTSLGGSTAWFHAALTWSVAADEVKAYINGAQVGTTQSTLGTWAGALTSTLCNVGAISTTPADVWSGYLAHCAVWTTPLSAAQVLTLATV